METLETIENNVSILANHYRKYLHTISRFKNSLIQALESSGKLMQIHLWRSSSSPRAEMGIIASLTADIRTRVQHVSCYYALQFLHMNFRHLDILALGITSGTALTDVYRQFIMNVGRDFRTLTKAYLETLLDIYLPASNREDFIICSVGTRADQDDIDLGIITADGAEDEDMNRALQKITQHMLVYATPLHLHLSEHVGKQLYTTTIPEYTQLFEKQIQDFVIISELLNATKIIGGDALFERFQEEVIARFFYHPSRDIKYHEGFLRGILGDARALLVSPLGTDTISPKDDAIRIIKSIITAKKAIHGVQQVNAWEIIDALKQKEPHLASEYEQLFRATSFLEMFKFLLQLFIAQEETFRLDEVDKNQLALIAQKMGYKPIGTISAWDQLIIDYYRHVGEVRKLCDFLLEDATQHLSSVSLFVKMLRAAGPLEAGGGPKASLAQELIQTARFFTGVRYWEDVLNLLQSDTHLLNTFIDGFEKLEEETKADVIRAYMTWAQHSPITIMRLITIMGKKQENVIGDTVSRLMSLAFLQELEQLPYITERLCKIYSHYPQFIHEFLQILSEPHYEYLYRILARPVIDERFEQYQVQLKDLCEIHQWSSRYFLRFFSRVISHHPEHLNSLTSSSQLSEIAAGLLAMVDVLPGHTEKKRVLGDYYDLEFLRIGIGSMRGADLGTTNREFTEFCDNYMRKLFDVCSEEVGQESTAVLPSTDTFAIFAAGGHAREQAYDDDYDLIAIVDTEDRELIGYATRIITRMNREILKRGLLPHYRLGEILGGFVSPLSQIIDYLSSDDEESFIDLSQLLGARMIVGSSIMKSIFNEKILDRFVFSDKAFYINGMIHEIHGRQNVVEQCATESCNLKETRGGLRDIEAVALMLKAYLGIYAPLSQDFFPEISNRVPEVADELDVLNRSMYYLRTIRDLYRITVAVEDSILPDYLERVAPIFRESGRTQWGSSEQIMEQVQSTLRDSTGACDRVIDFLQSQIQQ